MGPRIGLYRGASKGRQSCAAFGNHWRLRPRHRLRLDLMQVDESAPNVRTFLRSRVDDTFSFGKAKLELPTRESGRSRGGEGEVGPGDVSPPREPPED